MQKTLIAALFDRDARRLKYMHERKLLRAKVKPDAVVGGANAKVCWTDSALDFFELRAQIIPS